MAFAALEPGEAPVPFSSTFAEGHSSLNYFWIKYRALGLEPTKSGSEGEIYMWKPCLLGWTRGLQLIDRSRLSP